MSKAEAEFGITIPYREIGPWDLKADVEARASSCATVDDPDAEYRIVLTLQHLDEDGQSGLEGTLSTPWLASLGSAAEEARTLRQFVLAWSRYDEVEDRGVDELAPFDVSQLVDEAVARFRRSASSIAV